MGTTDEAAASDRQHDEKAYMKAMRELSRARRR